MNEGKLLQNTWMFTPIASSQASDDDMATVTTITPPVGATKMVIQAVGGDVYFTLDGTTPTADNAFLLTEAQGRDMWPISSATVVKLLEASGDATARWCFGK